MNIETANLLLKRRKESGLSQEALAEKLGVSRQAVSKWERAEASPDTDNLIALAKLYGISLDELLGTGLEKENDTDHNIENDDEENKEKSDENTKKDDRDYVNIGLGHIHVKDEKNEVHLSKDGIYVNENGGHKVNIGKGHITVDGEEYDKNYFKNKSKASKFPYPILVTIIYLFIGFCFSQWETGWVLYLTVPLYYSLVSAIEKKNARHFAYPVFAAFVYICAGMFFSAWEWSWIVFLTIPIYYFVV